MKNSYRHLFLFGVLLSTCLVSVDAFALGGLGIGHKSKAKGSNGVLAIDAWLCANMDCDKSDIGLVEKCAENAHFDYGERLCICDENYTGDGVNCVLDESCQNCPTGTYCHQGECYCSGTNKLACGQDNGTPVCCDKNSVCSVNSFDLATGVCTPKPETADCLTSQNCPDGQYCAFDSETGSTSSFEKGHCAEVGILETENYTYSLVPMDWYSARNWCQKQGLNMVDISVLSCPKANMTNLGFSDSACTVPSELQDLTQTNFWLLNTPSYMVCVDTDKAEENVFDTCEEATGNTQKTVEYQSGSALFFTTKVGTTQLNSVHWLDKKYNFLANALCAKN